MAQIQTDVDLAPFNTFKVSTRAREFAVVKNTNDLKNLPLRETYLMLGEGANLLFTRNYEGLIIKNEITSPNIVNVNDENVTIEVSSGKNWHELVMETVESGFSGIENLALIPGTVGAAPVQNLAAYGQTSGEVITKVTGWSLDSNSIETLLGSDCKFYYRDSIFKHELKNKFFITSVEFTLSKESKFDTHYHGSKPYESLQNELDRLGNPPYTPKQIAQAVINQRMVKMPDWRILGTAGSFFKNPFVSKDRYIELQKHIPDLQAYPVDHMLYPNPDDPVFKLTDQVKIPAGKLLDVLGWRGKKMGRVGTFDRHALVVVNYGGATGEEIWEFAQMMQEDVKNNFDIDLEPEVNIV